MTPAPATVHDLVPIAHVSDVERSTAFYRLLGFAVVSSRRVDGVLDWAWLKSGEASLMVARASAPIDPEQQAVLLYLYTDDLAALRGRLVGANLAASEIFHPDHMPNGELRVDDPDGYCLLIGQLPPWRGRHS